MDQAKKVRETRLRRAAARQGLALRKSGRRDPRALDFDKYVLVDTESNTIVAGAAANGRYSFTVDDVEAWLNGDRS